MISSRDCAYANTLIAFRYAGSVTFSPLISSTRRVASRPAEIVRVIASRSSAPATRTVGESKRNTLAMRDVRNDFVVARK